jgi:hypothetical protein
MSFDIMNLEVDGTFNNPAVIFAVALWSIILCLLTLCAFRTVYNFQRGFSPTKKVVLLLIILLLVMAVTDVAQFALGNIIYKVHDVLNGQHRSLSVGFWGGPPIWVAPLASSITVCLLVAWQTIKKRST